MNRFRTILVAVMAVEFLLVTFPTQGASVVTATVTVTNIAQVGTNWTVNSDTRTFTNNSGTPPQSWIQTTNGPGPTASNIYNSIIRFPYLSPNLTVQRTGTNTFTLRGSSIVIVTNNYFSVSYVTNTGTNLSVVQVPFESVVGETNRTNNAHWLVDAFNRFPYTNSFATNANVITNLLVKGARPYQEVLGPVGFRGRTAVNSNFFATNGFTVNLTNINPVLSNGVNYGNAFRSEGPGGNSLQVGSNAQSTVLRAVTYGNDSVTVGFDGVTVGTISSNGGTTAIVIGNKTTNSGGNNSVLVGASIFNTGQQNVGIGDSMILTNDEQVSIGKTPVNRGEAAISIGSTPQALDFCALALGFEPQATKINAIAIGSAATATHSNSAAIGPPDHAGTSVATTTTNEVVLGTANHHVRIPGFLRTVTGASNFLTVANSTNVLRGSFSYPRFDLATIANGNNISIPLGTNRFVRLSGTVTGIPTLCGFIGGATSGGLDGQEVVLHNDLGFGAILAQNTVDPVPANRIETADGADVTMANNGWAVLQYSGADARWHVSAVYPLAATATNTAPFGFITTNLLTGQSYTNLSQRGHVVATISMTNVLAGDVSSMSLIVDQDADGTWDTTNGPVRINGVALSAGEEQLFGLLQPGARFAFTNQSAGASPSATIRSGSCQWSRW